MIDKSKKVASKSSFTLSFILILFEGRVKGATSFLVGFTFVPNGCNTSVMA